MRTLFKIFIFAIFTIGFAFILLSFIVSVMDKKENVWCDKQLDMYVNHGMRKLPSDWNTICDKFYQDNLA